MKTVLFGVFSLDSQLILIYPETQRDSHLNQAHYRSHIAHASATLNKQLSVIVFPTGDATLRFRTQIRQLRSKWASKVLEKETLDLDRSGELIWFKIRKKYL